MAAVYSKGKEVQLAAARGQEPPQARLLDAMRDLGVSDRVAGDMLARYGQPYLWRKVRQTRYARRTGIAVKPAGWFIASVRENWRAPAGFDEWAELDADERREALRVSWGVCRRCGRRPCHCEERDQVEDGQDDESETEMDQSAGQIAPQDGFVSGQPG